MTPVYRQPCRWCSWAKDGVCTSLYVPHSNLKNGVEKNDNYGRKTRFVMTCRSKPDLVATSSATQMESTS